MKLKAALWFALPLPRHKCTVVTFHADIVNRQQSLPHRPKVPQHQKTKDEKKMQSGEAKKQDGLKLRIELNLDLELELKASIRGDITLALL